MWLKSCLIVIAALALAPAADAYIDPGTGMTFVSGIGALLAGFFAVVFGGIAFTFRRWVGACKSAFGAMKRFFGGRNPA